MFDHQTLKQVKKGVKIINVGRGPLILEKALIAGLDTKVISSAALDVFESEPIEISNKLLEFENCIMGSHNASNTKEGVERTNLKAIENLKSFLNEYHSGEKNGN
jgi:D-3-phosphoglycerate dehydrogenase